MICLMRKACFLPGILFCFVLSNAQLLSWTPQFPADNSTITITVDANKGNKGLPGYSGPVYMHLGIITNAGNISSDWKYSPTNWGSTTASSAASLGNNKWSIYHQQSGDLF